MVHQIPHLYPPPFETELVSSTNFREMADRSGSLSEATPQRPRSTMCWDIFMTFSTFDQRIPNSFETINVINRETSGAIRIFDITKNGHKRNSSQSRFHFFHLFIQMFICILYVYSQMIYIYIYIPLFLYIKSFSIFLLVFPFPA